MKTLLVVDDEAGIAEALEELLSDEGFHVQVALNGKEGLARIAEKRPDLILLDYMMPVMNGGEVLSALQGDAARRSIPVILMSVLPRSSIPQEGQSTAFLRKPFSMDRLLAEIHRLLGD